MTFPRAAAIAELGWSAPQRLEWHDFVRRLAALFPRYDALALPHAESAFAVQANTHFNRGANTVTVDLTTQAGYGDIRYTLDGRQPTARSPRYAAPLTLSMPVELRAATFADGVRLSHPRVVALRPELAQRRSSRELKLCSNDIALGLEDDAPLHGPRAVFDVDIQKPCWIFPDADLDGVGSVVAAVGQVPFNFQIGEALGKVRFAAPVTPAGELEVHQDTCEGELLARLPLAPATVSDAVTVLPPAATRALSGRHDLCLQFAQKFAPPASDPIWVLDWIQLVQGPPRSVQ
jgi:hexosaminidase